MQIYSSYYMEGLCPICWQDRSVDSDTVSHNGPNHPVHKRCIKEWLSKYEYCPICYMPVEKDSIFSWGEKCIRSITHIAKDLFGCQQPDRNAAALAALEEMEEAGKH